MRTLLSMLFLLFVFNSIAFSSPYNRKTSIKLLVEKKVYYENELIVFRLKFINNDTGSFYIGYNCSLEDDIIMELKFIDQKGKVHILRSDYNVCCIGGHINVNPGEEYETYGILISINDLHKFKDIDNLPIGNYSVFYSNNTYGISDTAHFDIVQNEFKDNYQRLLELKEIKDENVRLKKIRNYLHNTADSIFMNLLFNELLNMRRIYGDNIEMLESDMVFYFGIKPNSWSNDLYVFESASIMKLEYRMFDFLDKLIMKYPKTRVSYIAKKIINDRKITVF